MDFPVGVFCRVIDRKGRVVMPAPFRKWLGSPFVLVRAPGQRLLAIPAARWSALCCRYESGPRLLPAMMECALDHSTGRFRIAIPLCEAVQLRPGGEITFCGSRYGIWLSSAGRPDASGYRGANGEQIFTDHWR